MKRLLSAAVFSLVFASAIVTPPAIASPDNNPVITSGPPSDWRTPTVKTNNMTEPSNLQPVSNSVQQTKSRLSEAQAVPSGSNSGLNYPISCAFAPVGAMEADWSYRESLHNCKYGL